tara:strand:- start:8841 stop:9194 length:354 start_codon:yes stop_codon:yes gene_type:complete
MTKSTIEIHHKNLEPGSCKLLLKFLNKDNKIPFIQCQEYNISINNQFENGCIYTVPSTTTTIKSLWKDIQFHVPYLTNGHLHIPGKYDGSITTYLKNNTNDTMDITALINEQPWMLI